MLHCLSLVSAINDGLRPASGYLDDTSTDVDDVGVFYTTNSQHPEPCGRGPHDLGDLLQLSTTPWEVRDHQPRGDVSRSAYDLPSIGGLHQPASCVDDEDQQLAPQWTGDERTQQTLLVDFHR